MTELPFGLSFPSPAYVEAIPEAEREARVSQEGDCCEIDGELFFVRARVQLPVMDGGAEAPVFEWRVWVSVGGAAYVRLADGFDDIDAEPGAPAVAFVSSRLPDYPDTLDLRGLLHAQPGELPLFVLFASDHPLALEQRDGISIERVRALMQLAAADAAR